MSLAGIFFLAALGVLCVAVRLFLFLCLFVLSVDYNQLDSRLEQSKSCTAPKVHTEVQLQSRTPGRGLIMLVTLQNSLTAMNINRVLSLRTTLI